MAEHTMPFRPFF